MISILLIIFAIILTVDYFMATDNNPKSKPNSFGVTLSQKEQDFANGKGMIL